MERVSYFVKETLRLLIGLFVVLFIVVLFVTLMITRKSTTVSVNDQTIKVMVADSDEERSNGLSGKNRLNDNQGMLFIFDKADYYSFWMNKMKFSIDIIYIKDNKVTTVIENAKAPSSTNDNLEIFKPTIESDKILEINSGLAKKYGIKEGTEIKINNL